MEKKKAAIERIGGNASLDMSLQDVVDGIEDEVLVIDEEYRISFADSAMRQSLPAGKPFIGKHCSEVFEYRDHPCSSPLWKCPLTKVLQSGKPMTIASPDRASGMQTVSNRYISSSFIH